MFQIQFSSNAMVLRWVTTSLTHRKRFAAWGYGAKPSGLFDSPAAFPQSMRSHSATGSGPYPGQPHVKAGLLEIEQFAAEDPIQ